MVLFPYHYINIYSLFQRTLKLIDYIMEVIM